MALLFCSRTQLPSQLSRLVSNLVQPSKLDRLHQDLQDEPKIQAGSSIGNRGEIFVSKRIGRCTAFRIYVLAPEPLWSITSIKMDPAGRHLCAPQREWKDSKGRPCLHSVVIASEGCDWNSIPSGENYEHTVYGTAVSLLAGGCNAELVLFNQSVCMNMPQNA